MTRSASERITAAVTAWPGVEKALIGSAESNFESAGASLATFMEMCSPISHSRAPSVTSWWRPAAFRPTVSCQTRVGSASELDRRTMSPQQSSSSGLRTTAHQQTGARAQKV